MDITEDDLNRHIDALQANTSALLGRGSSRTQSSNSRRPDYDSASRGLTRYSSGLSSLNNQIDKVTSHFGSLGGGTEKLLSSFDTLLKGIVGGAIISSIVKEGHELAKSYHGLADIGQTFGGSLLELGKQAGEAGLPLGEFARLLEKNSTAAVVLQQQSALTGGNLGSLAASVRNNTREFGFYGMSVGQVNDLTSDYTETLRLQGRLSNSNMQTNAMNIASFAKDIADFSSVTGKSRKQIIEATMAAMRDVGFAATDLSAVQQKAAASAIAFTASMPGSAGDALSKMLSQSIAYGSSIFADGMQDFAQAGGAEFLGIIDNIAGKVKNGAFSDKDAQTALQDMQNFYKNNKQMLVVQAQAGNQQAKTVLAMMQQLNGLDAKQYAEKMRQQQRLGNITKFFATLDDQMSKLSGVFMESLFKTLEPLEKSFGKGEGIFNTFQEQFKSLGTYFGDMIVSLADPKNVAMIPVIIDDILSVGRGFASVLSGLVAVGSVLLHGFSHINDVLGKWGVGIIAAGLLFSRTIASVVVGMRALFKAGVVNVNGSVVNVNGRPLGGGNGPSSLDGLGPHDPKNKQAPAKPAKTRVGRYLNGVKDRFGETGAGRLANGIKGKLPGKGALGLLAGILLEALPDGIPGKDTAAGALGIGGTASMLGAGAAAIPLAGGYIAHEALGAIDPHEEFGKWMDRHVYGASWLDNQASKIGMGLSYEQQGLGGANPANPNTNNPYMSMTETNASERMNEVADTLASLNEIKSDPEMLAAMHNGNAINKRIAELLEEQKAIQAVQAAKNYQQQRKIIQNQDIQIGVYGE